jgi:hypothetical protein
MRTGEYKDMIEDIKEISSSLTIVEGIVDLHAYSGLAYPANRKYYEIRDLNECFWVLIGHASEEEIKDCLVDYTFEEEEDGVRREGEYRFSTVLKYDREEEGYGGYWYVDYIEAIFLQTFEKREREEKLSGLLDGDLDIFT